MSENEETLEQLRASLERLERERVREHAERVGLERLLGAIGDLMEEPSASVEGMLGSLRDSLDLEDAWIVRFGRERGYRARSSSGVRLKDLRWRDEGALATLTRGQVVVTPDLRAQPLWEGSPDETGPPGGSAVQLPLAFGSTDSSVTALVCTRAEPERFGERDVQLLQKFRSLLTYSFKSARMKLLEAEAAALRQDQVLLEALSKSSSRLTTLLSSMGSAVIVEDERGKVVLANDAFCAMFALASRPADLVGQEGDALRRKAAEAFPKPERFLDRTETILAKRAAVSDERFRTSDGRVLLLDFTPVDDNGQLQGHLWLFRDVTAERAREALNQAIVATALDAIITVDHRGGIVDFNPAAEVIFGHRSDEVRGRPMADAIIPPDLRAAHREGMKRYFASGEARILGRRLELKAMRADGTEFPIELTVNRIPDSQPPMFTGFIRDITEAKQREAELETAREVAEQASRAKSDFLAMMSHEIRTPMNAILGMTELSLDMAGSGEQRGLLRSVQTNAEALLHVINDVLDLSKVEAGRLVLREEAFSVADVMESVTEALAGRAFEKGLELSCSVDPALTAPVEGDPNRLRQVLVNLLGNAVKFTDQGEVSLESRCQDGEDGVLNVWFTVRDTGIGMSPQHLERIFDPFFQVDSSLSRDFGGTGLGLSISSSIAELMGGRVWAESSLGTGSAFHVEVPIRKSIQAFARRRASDARYERWQAWVVTPTESLAQGVRHAFDTVNVPTRRADEASLERGLAEGKGLCHVIVADQRLGLEALARIGRLARQPREGSEVRLCVLIPPGPVDPWRVEGPDVTIYATKPASRRKLCSVLAQDFAREDDVVLGTSAQRATESGAVLLVEDNPANQQYASRVLEGAGYQVTVASDGALGLEAALSGEYDLILTDLDMPNKDGIEMTREIIAELGERSPPILAFTAHVVSGFRERCEEVGMAGFVSKPAKPAELLRSVRQHATRNPTLLVVDDSPENRELVARFLAGDRVAMELLDNGRAAIDRVRRGGVAGLLLDMSMPGLDGYDTARRIRALPEGHHLPILAMTSWVGPEEEARCLEAGCTAYIEKPLRRDALAEAVQRLLAPNLGGGAGGRALPGDKVLVDPLLADLVPEYLEGRNHDVAALRSALDQGDLESIRILAHNLAGSGEAYGFSRLTELGRALENVIATGDREEASAWIGEIGRYLDTVEWEADADA